MDNLEKYIIENRQEFDHEIPGLNVWAGIQEKMEAGPSRRMHVWRQLRIAAAVALLLTAGGVIGTYLSGSPRAKSLSDLSPEYAEMERYFNTQVNNKLAMLASYNKENAVKSDIQDLDAIYKELQTELQATTAGNQEQIIEAMINTYQTKIEILEKVLNKIQSINSSNTKTEGYEIRI